MKQSDHYNAIPPIVGSLGQIFKSPIISIITICLFTFAMLLPAALCIIWKNTDALTTNLNNSAKIVLYLKKNTDQQEAIEIANEIRQKTNIAQAKLILKEDGIKDFMQQTGFGEILGGFKANPLPNVIIVYPQLSKLNNETAVNLIEELKNIPKVALIKTDISWTMLSIFLLKTSKWLFTTLLWIFSISSVLIISYSSYTTALLILNKAYTSMVVLQYQYFWYGLISGSLAIALVNFALLTLRNQYFTLQGLGICGLVIILISTLLSIINSKLAIKKFFTNRKK